MEYTEEQIKKLIKRQKAYAKIQEAEELIEMAIDCIIDARDTLDYHDVSYRLNNELETKLRKQYKRCFRLSQVVFSGR